MRYSLFILLFSLISFSLFGQTVESLKSQRAKSEKEITKLNNLLEEAKKSKNSSMQQISLYDKKIKETNNVIGTLNRELNTLNSNIDKNNASIESFEQQREKLLDLYERTVYEQWKVRNFENQFLYILASESFDQAYRRFRY